MSGGGTRGSLLEREIEGLNPQQRAAVEHYGTPLLILAGAGSGKTRVISTKIARLVESGCLEARSILAVTFTNKAAQEMRERTIALSPRTAEVMFRTFHAFGAWFLRSHAALAGFHPRFRICDEDDSTALLARVVDSLPSDAPASVRRQWSTAELRGVAAKISRAKDYCVGPSDFTETEALRWLYASYELRLRESGAADFGDLIMGPVVALREHAELRERMTRRFRAILVDEYQDSNRAQFELLKGLVGRDCYLCAVGDDDQSIYKFRGAVVENILSFAEVFSGTTVVRLERNYRSSQAILDVASAVVAHNRGRLGKELVADRAGGEPVALRLLEDQRSEACFVADLVGDGSLWSTAVLYRANHQSRPIETELARRGIPYRVVGTVRFFDRAEVKDAVAYLALLVNPRDELAFFRVVNHPARGVGKKSQERILAARASCDGDLLAGCARALADLPRSARAGAERFLALIEEGRDRLEQLGLERLVDLVLHSSGLMEYYGGLDSAEDRGASGRVDNLRELVSMAGGRPGGADGLCGLLEEAALDSGAQKGDDRAVTLITLHNTKGLEFDRVVITGLEDGVFPLVREGDTDVEEERRLLYVGITRARHRLYLTSCERRRVYGRDVSLSPSRFLSEIPRELLDLSSWRGTTGADGPGAEPHRARLGSDGDDGFPVGCGVYHESYGRGAVVDRWRGQAPGRTTGVEHGEEAEGGESVVVVTFETGKTARFVLRFSGLERIAHDDP